MKDAIAVPVDDGLAYFQVGLDYQTDPEGDVLFSLWARAPVDVLFRLTRDEAKRLGLVLEAVASGNVEAAARLATPEPAGRA